MTRRHLYGLIIGLTTFALGSVLASNCNARRPMSLCEVDANPQAYAGQTIRFRAIVYNTPRVIVAVSRCRNGETPAARIELNPAQGSNVLLPESHMSANGEWDKVSLADIDVVGELDPAFGKSCFGPKYEVTNARVERVFSVTHFDDSQKASEWMNSISIDGR